MLVGLVQDVGVLGDHVGLVGEVDRDAAVPTALSLAIVKLAGLVHAAPVGPGSVRVALTP